MLVPSPAGWSGPSARWWRAAGLPEELGPGVFPGPVPGQVQDDALAKAVPVAVGSVSPAARVAAARVRLNAMTASTSQAVFAVNFPEGRCASAELLRSAVVLPDLFDDRVVPVGLVGGDGVEHVGAGGGEERVEAPHIE